ncbi:MAG: nuclear transport factor 2 family protein [Gemmatimonadetes bacterium]|nr:nuclear transport factor 2 family protein [Gemmatimonadota bacterium]MYH18077.1 nuclear transport factor 2 family protein [Gemmatimonadota bacterium]MYK98912.1 nuclear transport factor 2 family protein [Gemmatimonadota bacterium]
MPNITVKPDCKNAPKKALLRDFISAFAHADIEGVLSPMSDDIVWNLVGDSVIEGKENVRALLEAMQGVGTSDLVIESIITHGREAAVNGVIRSNSGQAHAFCDVVQFTSASSMKIKTMTSYSIAVDEGR